MAGEPLTIRAAEYTRMTILARWNTHCRDCPRCICSPRGEGLKPGCREGRTLHRRVQLADEQLRAALALRWPPEHAERLI